MGTIGGNLCLDTRCTYYDQNYEWRKAIDFCMKKDGEICWVATSSPKCLAVSSTDTAPMLQALGATRHAGLGARRARRCRSPISIANDGMHYLTRRPDEILTVDRAAAADGWRSAYWKLRRRGVVRLPGARSAAVAARLDGTRVDRRAHRARRRRVAAARGATGPQRCSQAQTLTDERDRRRRRRRRPRSPSRWTTPTSSWCGARRWCVRS